MNFKTHPTRILKTFLVRKNEILHGATHPPSQPKFYCLRQGTSKRGEVREGSLRSEESTC